MKRIIFLLMYSLSVLAQQTDADKTFCDKARADNRSFLIYRVLDDKPDPIGDLALWRTFKLKTSEKIPAFFGNRRLMEKNQEVRNLSLKEKEKILKCFHSSDYQFILNDRNKIELTFPLLFTEDRTSSKDSALNNIESFNSKLPDGLKHPDDLVGVESKINPLKQKAFDEMFRKVICQSGVKPIVGETDTWSKEFRKEHIKPPFSKLLLALATGDTNRIMPTTKEKDLMNWILDQKDRSITIHKIFETSYLMNGGNVYKAFMTIENVLSENFYWGGDVRENLTSSTKLSKIINHTGGQFDLYGPWYHLFGMLLFGYGDGSGLKATMMGKIETGTSLFYKERNDRQENYMIAGGKIGARLKRTLKKIKTEEDLKKYCSGDSGAVKTSDYLNIVE